MESSSSSKIVLQVLAMSVYVVFVGALSNLLRYTPTDLISIGFITTLFLVRGLFECLLILIGFPKAFSDPDGDIKLIEGVCSLILPTIQYVCKDIIMVLVALAAVITVIVSVARLRGSLGTFSNSYRSLAVIRISFNDAIYFALAGYWVNTVAVIFPVIPTMLALLLTPSENTRMAPADNKQL